MGEHTYFRQASSPDLPYPSRSYPPPFSDRNRRRAGVSDIPSCWLDNRWYGAVDRRTALRRRSRRTGGRRTRKEEGSATRKYCRAPSFLRHPPTGRRSCLYRTRVRDLWPLAIPIAIQGRIKAGRKADRFDDPATVSGLPHSGA